jgi:hypothetical protein
MFEYLIGLIYVDLMFEDVSPENIGFTIGRFAWKYRRWFNRERPPQSIESFIENGLNQGNKWPLLKVGFFNGSIERFKECRKAYEYRLKEIGKSWF